MEERERLVVQAAAVCYLAAALAITQYLPSERDTDVGLVVGLMLGYALVSRVRFEFGNSWVSPEQVVLMAMLVLLPLNTVPVLVACAGILGTLPELARGAWHRERWMAPISDSWFVLGPVLVLATFAPGEASLADADIYLLAFGGQLLADACWWLLRDKLLAGPPARETIQTSLETSRVDATLAPIGFVVGLAAAGEPLALLAVAPLIWLLEAFSRERTARHSATLELNRAYHGTVTLLSDVIEFDDAYTGDHSRSVVDLVRSVAEQMDLDPEERREVEFAALLHDVGKIVIPKEVLNKPAKLTDEEFALMKTHTIEGQQMLDRVGGLLGRIGEIVRSCHERWDGKGYPDGLKGEQIPLAARIVFACDAFSAMTQDRVYRKGMSRKDAVAELVRNSGTQFDPAVVEALIDVVHQLEPAHPPTAEIRAILSASRQLRAAS